MREIIVLLVVSGLEDLMEFNQVDYEGGGSDEGNFEDKIEETPGAGVDFREQVVVPHQEGDQIDFLGPV